MNREQLIEFATFLDDANLLGENHIKLRVDQWLEKLNGGYSETVSQNVFNGRNVKDTQNIQEARKIFNEATGTVGNRKFATIKFLKSK